MKKSSRGADGWRVVQDIVVSSIVVAIVVSNVHCLCSFVLSFFSFFVSWLLCERDTLLFSARNKVSLVLELCFPCSMYLVSNEGKIDLQCFV